MADVGRAAQVSAQTVSRYFTGTGYVSAQTRARVEAAITELGYRPNGAARHLRTSRSGTIGVLTVGPLNHGSSTILSGLTHRARHAGFPLLIAHLDIDMEDPTAHADVGRAIDDMLSARVDGLVLSTPFLGTEDLLDRIWDTVPVVTISGRPRSAADSADVDSYAAARLATEHLVGLGHRQLLHVAGPADRNEAHERERAYRDVLAAAGLTPLPVPHGDWSADSGHAVGTTVDPTSFTAVVAGTDQMALGFVSALAGRGVVAPADYSIVGIDDMPDARYFSPPLTTVFMDFHALGASALEMLHHRISTGERLERRVVPPVLRVRASTAPLAP
jgi:DNA-binding LacI/PurR family transcriptional regulator